MVLANLHACLHIFRKLLLSSSYLLFLSLKRFFFSFFAFQAYQLLSLPSLCLRCVRLPPSYKTCRPYSCWPCLLSHLPELSIHVSRVYRFFTLIFSTFFMLAMFILSLTMSSFTLGVSTFFVRCIFFQASHFKLPLLFVYSRKNRPHFKSEKNNYPSTKNEENPLNGWKRFPWSGMKWRKLTPDKNQIWNES